MTPSDKEKITSTVLKHYPAMQCVYLFGSHAQGFARHDSDVDIALLLPPEQAKNETGLAVSDCQYDLSETLRRDVDLVNAREVSTVFQIQIIQGETIYCADQYAKDVFEMLTLSYYQKLNQERAKILKSFHETGRAHNV